VESATFIQSALEAGGINVAVNQMTAADYNTALGARKLQMFLGEWYSWGEDPIYQMNFLLKSTAFTDYSGYSNPQFDALVTNGINVTDSAQRDTLSQQAQQMAIEDAPWAFLYTRDSIIVGNSNVGGVTRPDDQYLRFQNLTLK
jgi:peptide/nickel transport system substrate-binding protein